MKLQIISKLAKNQSHMSTLSSSRNIDENLINIPKKNSYLKTECEYFPISNQFSHVQNHQNLKGDPLRAFFYRFDEKCSVRYARVETKLPEVKRELAPILQQLRQTPKISPLKNDYQFSFKKVESCAKFVRNKNEQSDSATNEREPKIVQHYIQNISKTKIKLRKFHSQVSIKDESTLNNSKNQHVIPIKRNFSVIKKDDLLVLRASTNRMQQHKYRLNTQNQQQSTMNNCYTFRKTENLRTQPPQEDDKNKLSKIRKELNEIYQMRRGPSQIKMRLF